MKVVKGIVIGLIGCVAVAALVLIILNMTTLNDQSDTLNSYIDRVEERYAEEQKKEDEFIEDGAVIGEMYTIRSTTAISDAYLNGQDPSGLSEEDKETYELAVKVLDEATKGKTTVYEKELGVFEWMATNISHNVDSSTRAVLADGNYPLDTPYGVLHSKNAVCVGYATTFRLLMNMLGLECHIPHNESHSWDLVKLDDDEWYFVDIYSASGNATPDYHYFNLNEVMGQDQIDLSAAASLPKANGRKYLYPVQIAKDADNIYQVPKKLKKVISKKGSVLSLRFGTTPSEDEVKMASTMIEAANTRIQENMTDVGEQYMSTSWCRDENDKFILTVYITRYDEGSSTIDPKSEEAKKMKKALDEAFGTTTGYDPFAPESDSTEESSEYVYKEGAITTTETTTIAA